jgi:type VI secretion system protein
MAVTLRFQTTGMVAGDGAPVVMRGPSLTIGRGPENDLVLPDPDRLISKNHCAIEDHGGNIVVIDFSTNGTFLNYGKVPLGKVMTPLNDGDVLSMGAYELVVSIASQRASDSLSSLPGPADEGPVSHGLAERSAQTADLLDDPAGGDFLDDLLGPENKPRGPGQIRRDDEIDPMMLPPLGEDEDPLLPPGPKDPVQGASHSSHSPSVQDHFVPRGSQRSVIPDRTPRGPS